MFSDLFLIVFPALAIIMLCFLIWGQLFRRLWGRAIKAWLPTFFGAVLLVALGLVESFCWEFAWESKSQIPVLWLYWGPRIAQAGLFSGLVYIGVTLWLHVFDYFLHRK
ncbi:MAG: hypothetical protein FGM54_05735 [Chitinophagaceae bacterium]|nr:hypothetical protein [Chitinophagaceae bacterium]